MNSTSIVKQAKLNAWAEKIRTQAESGLSVRDWCVANQVTKDQFYYWRQKLKDSILESKLPEIVPVNIPTDYGCRTNCTNVATTSVSSSTSPAFKLTTNDLSIEIEGSLSTNAIISIIKAVHHA